MNGMTLKAIAFHALAKSQIEHCIEIIRRWNPPAGNLADGQQKLKDLELIRKHVDDVIFDLVYKLGEMNKLMEKEVAQAMSEIVNGQ